MIRYVKLILFVTVAMVLVVFSISNRHAVIVHYWPDYGIETRLFLLVLFSCLLGFLLGKVSSLGKVVGQKQATHREKKRAKKLEHEKISLEKEVLKYKSDATQNGAPQPL